MALIKFESLTNIPMIVDMDVPVVTSDPGDGKSFAVNITLSTGSADTIDIAVSDNEADRDNILTTLNAAVEAAIADPYAIPVVDSIDHAGGYLEPEVLNAIDTIAVS
jgi:hypothetical protein